MSAPSRTLLFPCAPFKGEPVVAVSNESTSQGTHTREDHANCSQSVSIFDTLNCLLSAHRANCGFYQPQDRDLWPLDTALPSPPLMSTTGSKLGSPTTESVKSEGQDVKSETGSDVVMSPTWGVILISPRRCGPTTDDADAEQLWSDATYGICGRTYLADSPADPTAEPTFDWEKFFTAMRDNTLPNIDLVGGNH